MNISLRAARPVGIPVRFGADPGQQSSTPASETRRSASPAHAQSQEGEDRGDRLERHTSQRSNATGQDHANTRTSVAPLDEGTDIGDVRTNIQIPAPLPSASRLPNRLMDAQIIRDVFGHEPQHDNEADNQRDLEMGHVPPEERPPDYAANGYGQQIAPFMITNHPQLHVHPQQFPQTQAAQNTQQNNQYGVSKKTWAFIITLLTVLAGGLGATTAGWITTALNRGSSSTSPGQPTLTPTLQPTRTQPTSWPTASTAPTTPTQPSEPFPPVMGPRPTNDPANPGETDNGIPGNPGGVNPHSGTGSGGSSGNAGNSNNADGAMQQDQASSDNIKDTLDKASIIKDTPDTLNKKKRREK